METQQKQHLLFPLISGVFLGIGISFMINDTAFGIGFGKSVIIGIVAALTSFFLQFCYRPGNIFGGYMNWLEKNLMDNEKSPFRTLFKPLGGCAYCQNIWVSIFMFIMTTFIVDISWWLLIPSLMMAHFFLTLLDLFFWE
jgi:hypothetical protein